MAKREKNLAELSMEELEAKQNELQKDIFNLRNELSVQRKLEKPHLLKAKRHERARVLTIQTQKRKGS